MNTPAMLHYTYPNVHHICSGCEALMNFEKISETPRLKLAVICINSACEFYGQWFELLPTLLKPYIDPNRVIVTQ